MFTKLFDYGDANRVANKLYSGAAVAEPRSVHLAFAKIALDMNRAEAELFKSQGRRGGGSWARLKTDTVRKKGISKILFTRGSKPGYSDPGEDTLYGSLTSIFHRYSAVSYFQWTMEFGTARPFAYVHQYGSPSRNIPKREPLRFTARDEDRWRGYLINHMLKPFNQTVQNDVGILFK